MHNFRNLQIWIDAIEIADTTYTITDNFPHTELYGLSSQMQRAAVSIASNIAEGAGRDSDKDFAHFLNIALGSAYELETQLVIAYRRQFITEEQFYTTKAHLESLQKRILSFKIKLENKN